MRTITPKKYAVSLYESLRDAEKVQLPTLIKSFIALLVRHQDLHKADKIVMAFTAYANEQEKRMDVTVYSAKALPGTVSWEVAQQLKTTLHREVTVSERVDPSLIGGIILKYDDIIVDGSVKKRIELLAQTLRS